MIGNNIDVQVEDNNITQTIQFYDYSSDNLTRKFIIENNSIKRVYPSYNRDIYDYNIFHNDYVVYEHLVDSFFEIDDIDDIDDIDIIIDHMNSYGNYELIYRTELLSDCCIICIIRDIGNNNFYRVLFDSSHWDETLAYSSMEKVYEIEYNVPVFDYAGNNLSYDSSILNNIVSYLAEKEDEFYGVDIDLIYDFLKKNNLNDDNIEILEEFPDDYYQEKITSKNSQIDTTSSETKGNSRYCYYGYIIYDKNTQEAIAIQRCYESDGMGSYDDSLNIKEIDGNIISTTGNAWKIIRINDSQEKTYQSDEEKSDYMKFR